MKKRLVLMALGLSFSAVIGACNAPPTTPQARYVPQEEEYLGTPEFQARMRLLNTPEHAEKTWRLVGLYNFYCGGDVGYTHVESNHAFYEKGIEKCSIDAPDGVIKKSIDAGIKPDGVIKKPIDAGIKPDGVIKKPIDAGIKP